MSGKKRSVVLLCGLLAACDASGADVSASRTRDSLGITIVENAAAEQRAWRVDTFPLVIGANDSRHEFSGFTFPIRLSDGRVVVANGGSNQLQLFDTTGALTRVVGRQGGGPGEFEELGWLSSGSADTLLAYDWRLRRYSVFTPHGDFVRQIPLVSQSNRPVGALRGTVFVVQSEKPILFTAKAGVGRDTVELQAITPGDSSAQLIGRFPGSEYLVSRAGNSMSVGEMPFGKQLFVVAAGDHIFVSTSDRAEIATLAADGRVVRLVRWETPAVSVTTEDIEAYIAHQTSGIASAEHRNRAVSDLRQAPKAENKPLFTGLLVADDGGLWVRRFSTTFDARTVIFDVFDERGQSKGIVEMPRGFNPTHIAAKHVTGTWTDDDDVQHVRVYRLVAPIRVSHAPRQDAANTDAV